MSFGYLYLAPRFELPARLTLPIGAYRTNIYDTVGRLTSTSLRNSGHTVLDSYAYAYNPASQRTNLARADASTVGFRYDPIGQLTVADSSVSTEDRGYLYDAAWNLNRRTNNGTPSTFSVDVKNQLTTIPGGSCGYDGNGNLTSDPSRSFTYDDENQLTRVTWGGGNYRTDFTYDGQGRMRKRLETFNNAGTWTVTSETWYLYDGMRVIQERNNANTPQVSYTRGRDLSGSLEGAGGIGGLLARSHGYSGGNWPTHHAYFADGNGNVVRMLDSAQAISAAYRYDPYGNQISASGTMSAANVYRFSSKERIYDGSVSGYYYYGYRFYDPNLQRWLNRDPIQERGGFNLYAYTLNDSVNFIDPFGLKGAEDLCARPNADDAARKVLKVCNYHSKRENREYCGMICKNRRNGRIFKTGPIAGDTASCQPGNAPCPNHSTIVGVYHTHGEYTDVDGDGKDDYDSENFSPADRAYAHRLGVPIYLQTPKCRFKKYDPITGMTANLPQTKDSKLCAINTYCHF